MSEAGTSVVIIAHGRHKHLRRTLASVGAGTHTPREVVVVAMADPRIAEVVDALPQSPARVRVVDLDGDPRRLPLAAARNLGARTASGSRLVFLDVDCLAGPSLVADYEGALDRLARRAGGPVVAAGPVTYLPQDWQERLADPSGGGLAVLRRPHAARPDPAVGQLVRERRLDLFWSLSFAVTADDFDRIGGFDEAYRGYGGEDTDFARRLERAGGSLWWVGGADAFHQYHPVSAPPVEHLDDILRNASLFAERWGAPCMDGWLEAFARLGLAEQAPDGRWRRAAPATGEVLHVVPGAAEHGIGRHALGLVRHGAAPLLRLPDPSASTPQQLATTIVRCAAGRGVHLHLNDVLLGDDTVRVVASVAARLPASLTLHDVPDPREGAARYDRRARAYADLWRMSVGVVVASHHERRLLEDAARYGGASPEALPSVAVVPLPLRQVTEMPDPAGARPEPVVGVLGYVYPGKGHEQAIRLAARLGLSAVVALGAPASGHEGLVDDLARQAAGLGVGWELTGFLSDEDLLARARRVALPLAWHAHASASGSIGTWLASGRRPLVAAGGWTRELARRCPGSVTLVDDESQLVERARAALADPSPTVLPPGTRLRPTLDEAWRSTVAAIRAAHHAAKEGHDV